MRFSEAEWRIMNVVWRAQPVCARDVLEALTEETDWTYSTVKTYLTRLTHKGVLREQKRGLTGYYEAVLTQDNARKSALGSLVNQAFEGACEPLVTYLVSKRKLSESDRRALEQLLKQQERTDEQQ